MKKQLSDALDVCLKSLKDGETLEAVLARFPHLAAELRPLLEAAQAAWMLGQFDSPVGLVTRGRARVSSVHFRAGKPQAVRWILRPSWRVALTVLIVVAFLALSTNSAFAGAAQALPGDTLYPLKRVIENIQLVLTTDPSQRQVLQEEFNQHRVNETLALILSGRVEVVEFNGIVSSQTQNGWVVAGIPVNVSSLTLIDGAIRIGVEASVSGETQPDGSILAITIVAGDESDLQVTQIPEPIETNETAAIETDEAEATETAEAEATETAEATLRATKTPKPTRTPKPTNTHRPIKTPKP
ncbi:MAG: hypothetical protein HY781_09100 [Chloroflexi bacterium]|nr:hypothetical protein [Chloroflexota bacterium]